MPRTLTVVAIPPPPPTPRDEIVDTLHGERVADPYRWLEDAASTRVRAWTDAQNARTRALVYRLMGADALGMYILFPPGNAG